MPLPDDAAALLRFYLGYRSLVQAAGPLRVSLAGSFLLLCEPGAAERAAAARIAGAATLLVVPGAEQGKALVRAGFCDFLVTDLDEALRILKNELRRKAPVSVCLQGHSEQVLRECVARGVQPELLDVAENTFASRGASLVVWQSKLQKQEHAVMWHVPDGSLQRMHFLDAAALPWIEDAERRGWLERSSPVLGRRWQRLRLLPMWDEELASFLAQVAQAEQPLAMTVERDGEKVWPRT